MKLSFHFLWFYACLIGILSFSTQERLDKLMDPIKEQIINCDPPKKERKEKEFRKEEEEENKQEENEENDNSEDIEIEEEYAEYFPHLSTVAPPFQKIDFAPKNLLKSSSHSIFNYCCLNYPPFYILFACLKIDY